MSATDTDTQRLQSDDNLCTDNGGEIGDRKR